MTTRTAPGPHAGQERGRTLSHGHQPRRAFSTSPSGRSPLFGQQFTFKKERSPHLSYDRITRHASPTHNASLSPDDEIVPKVPQPYRTSFSAVTAPYRVPKKSIESNVPLAGQGCLGLGRNTPLRATLPIGALSSHKSDDLLARTPTQETASSQLSSGKATHRSHGDILEGDQSTRTNTDSLDGATFSRNNFQYASTPAKMHHLRLKTPSGVSNVVSNIDRNESVADSVFTEGSTTSEASKSLKDVSVRSFMENSDPDKVLSNGGLHPALFPSEEDMITATVEKKTLISVEYAHLRSVDYFELLEKQKKKKLTPANEQTNRILAKLLNGRFGGRSAESKLADPPVINGDHKPIDAKTDSEDVNHIRSNVSLPSEDILSTKTKTNPIVKKSHSSSSVWSIFKNFKPLSPRTFRRGKRSQSLGRSPKKSSNENNPTGSDTNLTLVTVDISTQPNSKPDKKDKSPKKSKKSPKSPKKSKPAKSNVEVNGVQNSEPKISRPSGSGEEVTKTNSPSMVPQSARILKSIGDNTLASHEKSVYLAFKEKQSPKLHREACSLKPQALKPVEIPDNLLYEISENPDHKVKVKNNDAPRETGQQDHSKPMPNETRSQEPPQTLNVRNISKLNKNVFHYPSMSEESIGQCSLDVHGAGSEPSLASQNGQHKSSSIDASKQTLYSQDSITSNTSGKALIKDTPRSSTGSNQGKSNLITSRVLTFENPGLDDVDSHTLNSNVSPKTPSYLKLSCSVSGYNKYQSYNLPANNTEDNSNSPSSVNNNSSKIRVIKCSPPPEDGRNLSNGTPVLVNGHCEDVSDVEIQNLKRLGYPNGCPQENGATEATQNGPESHLENRLSPSHINTQSHSNSNSRDSSHLVNGTVEQNGVDLSPNLSNVRPDSNPRTPVGRKISPKQDIATPNKDGAYFLQVTDDTERALLALCAHTEADLETYANDIPEEALGKMRAAIGKATLLTTKKFKQFRGLCHQNQSQNESEPFHTTSQDLAGFWDMVLLQVQDMYTVFDDIEKMKQNGWNSPIRQKHAVSAPRTPASKSIKSKPVDTPVHTPKSSKSREAAKAREEARKRLLAAKKAGRQRKASQGEEEVEIFVS